MANSQAATEVANWQFEARLERMFTLALPKLGPEAGHQLKQIISPESLAIMAGVLITWVVSHGFGVGEIIDVVILAVGVFAIGMAIFSGLDHLYDSVAGTYRARTEVDLEMAADHLAKAIGILGIQAVLAVLFRKTPVTGRGGRYNLGTPPRNPGWRYKPKITRENSARYGAGEGGTNPWGDITISLKGTAKDQQSALLHEKIHQILAPKIFFLRNFRVQNLTASYLRSSLWRYLEEALAETASQLGVNGVRNILEGLKFPVMNGYIFLTRSGGFSPAMRGNGLIPEAASLVSNGIILGMSYRLWFRSDPQTKNATQK